MAKEEKRFNLWYFFGAMFLAFILFRFFPIGRSILLILMVAAVFGGIGYYIFQLYSEYQHRKEFQKSALGQLDSRIAKCREAIQGLRSEMKNIEESMADLQSQLLKPIELPLETTQKTKKLLDSFANEKTLREAKITFYESCIRKLEKLQHNHILTEKLQKKVEQLKKLKESHYEELADMEALRTEIAYEEGFFQSFDELSLRVLKTESLNDTVVLQKEMEKMIGEV